jgi:hypothetical protein
MKVIIKRTQEIKKETKKIKQSKESIQNCLSILLTELYVWTSLNAKVG